MAGSGPTIAIWPCRSAIAASAVEAGAVTLADDHRELRHGGLRGREDHLSAVTDDALLLDLRTHHEAGDVGEVDERNIEGVAEPDESRRLVGGIHHQHAALDLRLVGDDPDR